MVRNSNRPSAANFSCKERASLDVAFHSDVNILLKILKFTHKRFQAAFTSLLTEGQVLERIFYKGKNQHRSSLLWRRLSDLRKFIHRVEALAPCRTIEAFSRSFSSKPDAPLFKGSWTHYPSEESLKRANQEFKMLRDLFETFALRAIDAFQYLSFALQSGAFMQVLLTVTAIASRLHCLAKEMASALYDLLPQIQRLQTATRDACEQATYVKGLSLRS